MSQTLLEIAASFSDGSNPNTKFSAHGIYELYEQYFSDLRDAPITMLELGVSGGESLKTFANYFAKGTIVGVDIADNGLDFSAHPNVRFEIADQRDARRLAEVCTAHAPGGLDIIIDDASHFGAASLDSYKALFPFLKPGGLYIVEDWATGYWTDWPDGGLYASPTPLDRRIPTHDFGMVGFVKHLVDEVMSIGIRPSMHAPLTRPNRLELMHVHKPIVVLQKAR